MDFKTTLSVSASGLRAQQQRMKTIAENIANADSTATTPGGDPYRRQIPTMKDEFDKELNATVVKAGKPIEDKTPFPMKYDPGNPMADAKGYIKQPNVQALVEVMDMREAQRSYEAGLNAMDVTKAMLSQTISLLNK